MYVSTHNYFVSSHPQHNHNVLSYIIIVTPFEFAPSHDYFCVVIAGYYHVIFVSNIVDFYVVFTSLYLLTTLSSGPFCVCFHVILSGCYYFVVSNIYVVFVFTSLHFLTTIWSPHDWLWPTGKWIRDL